MATQNKYFSIYTISHNGRVVYVGMTSKGKHRWVCHKTKARNPNQHSRPIHDYMRENTTNIDEFPEFSYSVIAMTDDEDTAKELENYFTKKFNTFEEGFNRQINIR